MPLEVRQIGIRFSIGGGEAPPAGQGQAAETGSDSCGLKLSEKERASVVDECVGAVLAELSRQSKR